MSDNTNDHHLNLQVEEGGGTLTVDLRDGTLVEPETEKTGRKDELEGSVLKYESPFEPVAEGDWNAMKDDVDVP